MIYIPFEERALQKMLETYVAKNFVKISAGISCNIADNIISELNLPLLPPQPINKSGKKCALRRISYFKKYATVHNIPIDNAMIVSIENYFDTNVHYNDFCTDILEYKRRTITRFSFECPTNISIDAIYKIGDQYNYGKDSPFPVKCNFVIEQPEDILGY